MGFRMHIITFMDMGHTPTVSLNAKAFEFCFRASLYCYYCPDSHKHVKSVISPQNNQSGMILNSPIEDVEDEKNSIVKSKLILSDFQIGGEACQFGVAD